MTGLGNVRQLENLIERLVITVQDPHHRHHGPACRIHRRRGAPGGAAGPAGLFGRADGCLRGREIIRDTYRRCGTTVAVARELGISQATAARKVAKYVRRQGRREEKLMSLVTLKPNSGRSSS